MNRSWMVAGLLLVACKGHGPQTSECEATCDWAVPCAATEYPVDEVAVTAACLDQTNAVDGECANAEAGKLNAASSKALTACTNAIDSAASEGKCDAFAGRIDQMSTSTPPAACAATGPAAVRVFGAAQDAVAESNAGLCTRVATTYCARFDECLVGDFGGQIPQQAIDSMGGTPVELCNARLGPVHTTPCTDNDLYAPGTLTSPNLTREAARECMRGFSAVSCNQLLGGNVPPVCAGAFSSVDQAQQFAEALVQLATDFHDAAQ